VHENRHNVVVPAGIAESGTLCLFWRTGNTRGAGGFDTARFASLLNQREGQVSAPP
jgi:hypothetical protein